MDYFRHSINYILKTSFFHRVLTLLQGPTHGVVEKRIMYPTPEHTPVQLYPTEEQEKALIAT